MADRKWTRPQADAIAARGGSVLVSAAAGSGKTAVLVERVAGLLCDPHNPVSADRLLVVTFSNAAAAEMKQRLGVRLTQMSRQRPGDAHLQRQLALLQKAQISTIHSFCLELVRSHFQDLNITPDFTIADERELDILMQDCARDTVEEYYEKEDNGAFLDLVELLSTGRDDSRLVGVLLQVYGFCRSHPFYEGWLDRTLAMYDSAQAVGKTIWGESLLRYAQASVEYLLAAVEQALVVIEGDQKIEAAYGEAFRSDARGLGELLGLLQGRQWDASVEALAGMLPLRKLGPLRGHDEIKARLQTVRERTKKTVRRLSERCLSATEEAFREDLSDLQPKIQVLFQMVKEFGRRLQDAKAAKKRLDFSDLEHFALQLLAEPDGEGGYRSTQRGRELSAGFDCILVDEYQDTNEVQDTIFSCVSRSGENLFMVGDVKQSIYRFRQAMPEIFMEKKERYASYGSGAFPAKILLDTNFRSRSEVTGAVNYLFGLLMSKDMGEIDYGEEEQLRCGATYPDAQGNQPELLLVDTRDYGGSKTPAQLEAGAIGDRILEMLREGYQVTENGKQRPARPRDFCILLRSPRAKAPVYVKELAERGLAAWAENAGGFLAAREVAGVVAMLKSLDNPLLDVELVAALLSPLFHFTDDDLADIRLCCPGEPFYMALRRAAQEGMDKAARFLALFDGLRRESAMLSADRLLMRLYDETDVLAVVRAMRMGESRRANLLLLIEYASKYHKLGYKRLGGFVSFLNRLSDRGGDLAPASTLGEGADVVRIMSVHKSKGLEFPVVFLADCAKAFNTEDLRSSALLHSRLGFACVRRERELRKQYPSVPLLAVRQETQRSMLSEEMRVLYVALTRAREKLIVSGVVKGDLAKKLGGLASEISGGRLPPYIAGEASGYLDWVLMALLHHPSALLLRAEAGVEELEQVDDGNPWQVRLCKPTERPSGAVEEARPERTALPDPKVLEILRDRAAFRYPHQARTRTPAKLAVSTVAKGRADVSRRFERRPKFLSRAELTAAERGNAMHKFMQFADYHRAKENIGLEIRRMGERGFLTPAEIASLSKARLNRFFQSDLADRIFASGQVWRELKFTAECGKDMLGQWIDAMDEESKIVLQGVADCVFVEVDGAVIVDYKTDRVDTTEELVERYRSQLVLYRAILEQSMEFRVKECVLYSFALGRAVPILE